MPELSFSRPAYPHSPSALATTLTWLRACAVIGQAVTVLVVAHLLALPIDESALLAGVVVLAIFDIAVYWRLQRPWPVSEVEVVAHLAFDSAILCYLLYLTGGATNPFVSLYIVPIAFAAMTLSPRYLAASVVSVCAAYLFLLLRYRPLPEAIDHMHAALAAAVDDEFSLHVVGMAINFAISAVLLGFFIWRLARELRLREALVRRERERALRGEGILAIATQAAGTAHELNTPLSTIRTLIAELRREHAGNVPLDEDLSVLGQQADRCRAILRELVQIGSRQLAAASESLSLSAFVTDCAERFRLLRPTVDLDVRLAADVNAPMLRIVPALRHALLNLLNNAADASLAAGSDKVEIAAKYTNTDIAVDVRDFGAHRLSPAHDARGLRFVSDKEDGLGLGLALANATIERLRGTLHAEPSADGGTLTRLRLPLDYLRATP